jgi:FkbM family methyltransferase
VNLRESVSRRLKDWSARLEEPRLNREVLRFRDCAETVRAMLSLYRPVNLLDIGAHVGGWSWVLHRLHPGLASTVMVEPQVKRQDALQALQLPGVRKTVVHCALGAASGSFTLVGGTASASLLRPARDQLELFPGSMRDEEETVGVRTLDDLYGDPVLPRPDLIKLDVQGGELGVLEGGRTTVAGSRCLVVELSLREFYEGQPPMWELLRFIDEAGFRFAGRGYEWRSAANSGELLQVDGIFLRRGA